MLRRKEKDSKEIEANPDRYLITYADLITLLLGLFVILYAISKIDEEKYKEFATAFSEYFKSTKEQVLQGGGGVLPGVKNGLPEPILPNTPNTKSIEEIAQDIYTNFKDYIEKGTFSVKLSEGALLLTFPEKLLFESAKADIQTDGKKVLDSLAQILRGIKYQVSVDGHTDSDPIRSYKFESNWHLSVARAANVAYYLMQRGLPEQNVVIRGFADQRPVSDNLTAEGKAKNRRVEINITELPKNALTTEGYVEKQKSP